MQFNLILKTENEIGEGFGGAITHQGTDHQKTEGLVMNSPPLFKAVINYHP